MDHTRYEKALYVSTVREEDQGGFEFPVEMIAAAGAAGLSLHVSVLVMLDDYDDLNEDLVLIGDDEGGAKVEQ